MEDINRDDILFDAVNKHSEEMKKQRDEENRRQEIINHNYYLAERAIATSLKKEEIAREAAIQGKEISEKRRKKTALILVGMATTLALLTPATKTAVDNFRTYRETSVAVAKEQNEAIDKLYRKGLINDDGQAFTKTESNTSISYQRLDVSSPEDVYIYKTILSDTEFNKLVSSLGYSSFGEYLISNGFDNEKEFTDTMKKNILMAHRNEVEKNGGNAR